MMNRFYLLFSFLFITSGQLIFAQTPARHSASDIELELQKLNILGNVLYVAAHPDDENTQLIAYLSKGKLLNTAYFACTRGDGGQNLIGPEIEYRLGVIRTLELLQARKIDGGHQFFSRAVDFGYSKNPDETFKFWNKEKILSDLVWVIREFRPDVIITRFDTVPGVTHGHHTASAILAMEAFKEAGDKSKFPEQLKYVSPWGPSKLFWNTAWWYYRRNNMDTTGLIRLDVGGYNPLIGKSYSEIAAEARSMHKSQGFGVTARRGEDIEFFKQWNGVKSKGSVFDGLNLTWSRVKGGPAIESMVKDVINNFNALDPAASVPRLINIRKAISGISDSFWKKKKLDELDRIIYDCAGLYLETIADKQVQVEGDSISLKVEAVNRSGSAVRLDKVSIESLNLENVKNVRLVNNMDTMFTLSGIIPSALPVSEPYWLVHKHPVGSYTVNDQQLIGKPLNDPPLIVKYFLTIDGEPVTYSIPVVYKYNDPVDGEVYKTVAIAPPAVIGIKRDVEIFTNGRVKSIDLTVTANRNEVIGQLSLVVNNKWKVSPQHFEVNLKKGESKTFTFTVEPSGGASVDFATAQLSMDNKTYDRGMGSIDYPHIPEQYLFPLAEIKMVSLQVKTRGKEIGYIQGAGDDIPQGLEQLGYHVTELTGAGLNGDLGRYDAIVVGVRAYNTVDALSTGNQNLFDYVKKGGTLITQYNNNYRMVTSDVSPYPLTLSRDRITNEDSPVRIIAPDNPIVLDPNVITGEDFEGWVQERGLYFPGKWDDHFTAVISSEDPGEKPLTGGILVAKYGSGYFIYTSLSWFREIPDGVPGAYRIFANMLSLGN